MNVTKVEQSIILAAYFRGHTVGQKPWTSNSDQVVTLSLFYTDDITFDECESRFSNRGHVGGLYDDEGELHSLVAERYRTLVELIKTNLSLIEGGGDVDTPADPTYTACRLTKVGVQMALEIVHNFPSKPEFQRWPDTQEVTK